MYTLPIMFALWCSICTSWKKDFFTEKSKTTDQPSAPMILFKSVGRDLCVKFSYLQFIFKFKFVYELHVPIISVCFSHVGVKCSDTRSAHTGECRSAIWLKPKSWLIDMRRRWAFEQGAPYAVIIHRAALLANSLLLSSLEPLGFPHVVFTRDSREH